MNSVRCPTEADTRAWARKLAATLRPGDIILLAGSLGAGKTSFTAGLASGLGIDEAITSPSFILMRRYDSGFLPLVHADVYRLGSLNEFDDLDAFDLASDGVLVIEWGNAVESSLPADHLRIDIDVDNDARILRFNPTGSWSMRGIEQL